MTGWSYDPRSPKPHVHPLSAPNGRVLTRSHTPDHPWQRGLWFVVKFVDDDNFWEELEPHGIQVQRDEHRVDWVRPDGEVAVVERRTLTPTVDGLDWRSVLTADDDVVLDRTPFQGWGGYGGLAFRGSGDWQDTRLTTDDGRSTDALVGEPSRWCDLSGPDAGVVFMDHPDNPRFPVPWYANVANAVYGTDEPTNFVNAAFLFHGPLTLPARRPLAFRYRIAVHDGLGSWDHRRAEDQWSRFAHE